MSTPENKTIQNWEQISSMYGHKVVRTEFACGMNSTIGGNLADPTGIYAESFGKLEVVKSPEACGSKHCSKCGTQYLSEQTT